MSPALYYAGLICDILYNMWARGPIPGFSPKAEMLALFPKTVCCKKHAMCNIVGYVVYPSKEDMKLDVNPLSSAGNSRDAWEKALCKVATYNGETKQFEVK